MVHLKATTWEFYESWHMVADFLCSSNVRYFLSLKSLREFGIDL